MDDIRIDHRGPAVFVDLGDGLEAAYALAPEGGRVVITEVRVRAKEGQALPVGGLTARHLRRLRLGQATRVYREDLADAVAHPDRTARFLKVLGMAAEARGHGDWFKSWVEDAVEEGRPWLEVVARLSARPQGESRTLRLARTAAMYVLACDEGIGAPNERVAAQQGRSMRQVRDDLYAARHAGLLTPTLQGRAGGDLTEKGVSILGGAEFDPPAGGQD